eukprot:9415758-Alexandrium_andersonii.AAC.1
MVRQIFEAVTDDALAWLEPELVHWRGKDGKGRAERRLSDIATVQRDVLKKGLPSNREPCGK